MLQRNLLYWKMISAKSYANHEQGKKHKQTYTLSEEIDTIYRTDEYSIVKRHFPHYVDFNAKLENAQCSCSHWIQIHRANAAWRQRKTIFFNIKWKFSYTIHCLTLVVAFGLSYNGGKNCIAKIWMKKIGRESKVIVVQNRIS